VTAAHPELPLSTRLADEFARLAAARHHDPHAVLGPHPDGADWVVIVHLPGAEEVRLDGRLAARDGDSDFYLWRGPRDSLRPHYEIQWRDPGGRQFAQFDPYSFEPLIDAADLAQFAAGTHASAWRFLGAHPAQVDGIDGTRFAVWAPDAERVSVVGDFCVWDGRRYPLRSLGGSGVWEIFLPGVEAGCTYKYEIRARHGGGIHLKSDPYARAAELRPANASIVAAASTFRWRDGAWRRSRAAQRHSAISIYEVHLPSWRQQDDRPLSYRELARQLIPYVKDLGFTHIELLPITEYPLDDSWGYQATGYFAPTARHGGPDDLRAFIDACHRNGIGVLLDWVPGHFPRDAHGLANFDGSACYEYADAARAEHRDWGTLIFNYERHEVRSFLLSSACYWLEEFHFDGLRVDAVASMIYLDFGRRAGDFVPNKFGDNRNLEAIAFLQQLNRTLLQRQPHALIVAEESSEWRGVSRPVESGGLGFTMKWNMGWMHDTLAYFREDPLYRSHHHRKLTFSLMYAFNENFVLPLSHDEVVHLKRSLLGKMPGDRWQQLANLRLLLGWMWTMPGKKLLFMGGEFAQDGEWDFRRALPWEQARDAAHAGIRRLVADLNALYRGQPALHEQDFDADGFRWMSCDDEARSVVAYCRYDRRGSFVLVVCNFTPVPRESYRIGVPRAGEYREILNSDSQHYGGSNLGNLAAVRTRAVPCLGQPCSLDLLLPPLSILILAAPPADP
jgi:1,4-alpha-glucan branching enzyme